MERRRNLLLPRVFSVNSRHRLHSHFPTFFAHGRLGHGHLGRSCYPHLGRSRRTFLDNAKLVSTARTHPRSRRQGSFLDCRLTPPTLAEVSLATRLTPSDPVAPSAPLAPSAPKLRRREVIFR